MRPLKTLLEGGNSYYCNDKEIIQEHTTCSIFVTRFQFHLEEDDLTSSSHSFEMTDASTTPSNFGHCEDVKQINKCIPVFLDSTFIS